MRLVLPVEEVGTDSIVWKIAESLAHPALPRVAPITILSPLVEESTEFGFVVVHAESNQYGSALFLVLSIQTLLLLSITLYHIEPRLTVQVSQVLHHSVNFVSQSSLVFILLFPCVERWFKVALLFDKLATLQECSHLFGLLSPHLPLSECFGAGFSIQGLSQVCSSQSAIFLSRGIDLPSHEPVFHCLLLLSRTLDCSMMLLDVLLFDRPISLHLAHLFSCLHLEHNNVFIFLLTPRSHGSFQSVFVIKIDHTIRGLALSIFQMSLSLELIYTYQSLWQSGLVEGVRQDSAALATTIHVAFPAVEDVIELRSVEHGLIVIDESSHSVLCDHA